MQSTTIHWLIRLSSLRFSIKRLLLVLKSHSAAKCPYDSTMTNLTITINVANRELSSKHLIKNHLIYFHQFDNPKKLEDFSLLLFPKN